MVSSKRYPEEFKIEAVKQVIEQGHAVTEVATRLGISQHSLYAWLKKYALPEVLLNEQNIQQEEIRRQKAELKRVTEELDILKKAAAFFVNESPQSTLSSWLTKPSMPSGPCAA